MCESRHPGTGAASACFPRKGCCRRPGPCRPARRWHPIGSCALAPSGQSHPHPGPDLCLRGAEGPATAIAVRRRGHRPPRCAEPMASRKPFSVWTSSSLGECPGCRSSRSWGRCAGTLARRFVHIVDVSRPIPAVLHVVVQRTFIVLE